MTPIDSDDLDSAAPFVALEGTPPAVVESTTHLLESWLRRNVGGTDRVVVDLVTADDLFVVHIHRGELD